MKTLGIDVGSRFVKFVGWDGSIIFSEKIDTIDFYRQCRTKNGDTDISRLDIFKTAGNNRLEEFEQITATGYGRYNIKISGAKVISEIQAHALGAMAQTSLEEFTLIDLGGQDTKVIKVRDSMVDDFVMNDKCAAGSGRYLENISNMLKITPDEMARCYENPVTLSTTCAIFGESEVIGKIADGASIESISAGANQSVALRVASLSARHKSKKVIVTGGVAKNSAVIRFLKDIYKGEIIVPKYPDLNGAIGATSFRCVETAVGS